jgi:hypothetical protein
LHDHRKFSRAALTLSEIKTDFNDSFVSHSTEFNENHVSLTNTHKQESISGSNSGAAAVAARSDSSEPADAAAGVVTLKNKDLVISAAVSAPPPEVHKEDSLMFFEFDIQDYIGCSLKFRVKAVIVTLNDKNDDFIETHNINNTETEYNANRLKNDIKTKCEKIASEDITSSFPNSEWAKLKDPYQISSKIEVTKEFSFQSPFDKNGVLYYLGE